MFNQTQKYTFIDSLPLKIGVASPRNTRRFYSAQWSYQYGASVYLLRTAPQNEVCSCYLISFSTSSLYTICPRSNYPFYIISYYIKWGITYCTDGSFLYRLAVNSVKTVKYQFPIESRVELLMVDTYRYPPWTKLDSNPQKKYPMFLPFAYHVQFLTFSIYQVKSDSGFL